MKATFVLALVGLLAASAFGLRDYQREFVDFMHTHGKSYTHDEFSTRFQIFKKNLDSIDFHNSNPKNTFTLGMNQFGDLSKEEFRKYYLGLKTNSTKTRRNVERISAVNIPTSIDWRTKGAVTPVKNQGQCGSCWSFSTTGALEGAHFIKSGSLESYSEQQLVDCSQSYGNDGCDGGLMDYAFEYVEAQGIELESVYPYTATDGTCQYAADKVKYKNKSYKDVAEDDQDQLTAAVANAPVSVAIEADQDVFQFYTSGVLNSADCGTQLDHGVLAVGYGADSSGTPYYIVKNSWGASWGMQGYVLIYRGSGSGDPGICGIASQPSFPTN